MWEDITIPALIFAAGCLAVVIWALLDRGYYKATNERLHEEHGACIIERDTFKREAEKANKDYCELTDQLVAAEQEQDECLTKLKELTEIGTKMLEASKKVKAERDALQKELDTLKTPVEAVETNGKRRTGKAKVEPATATKLSQE